MFLANPNLNLYTFLFVTGAVNQNIVAIATNVCLNLIIIVNGLIIVLEEEITSKLTIDVE